VEQQLREFSEFYAAAKDDCLRIVLVSVGDRALAEDLVAEAFTRAWMSWRKVRDHPVPACVGGADRTEHARVLVAPSAAGSSGGDDHVIAANVAAGWPE
jgi:hypothetical protein